MKYKLVIFDMDGTILNTLDDLADALNFALGKSGFPKRTIDEVKSFVGNGIRKLVERGVPNSTSKEQTDTVFADFSAYYKLHCADKTKAYDGIKKLIEALRKNGVKTAVVSNKADFAVQDLCVKYFDGLFDAAVGEKNGVRKKPFPDSVEAVLEKLSTSRENAVYIGDSEVDIETAKNAKMNCISVCWGFRSRETLVQNGASVIVSDTDELLEQLL